MRMYTSLQAARRGLPSLVGSLVGMALCLALVLPDVVLAAPPAGEAAPPDAEVDPVMAEAKQLFDAGVARYTAADYGEAVTLWLEAFSLVPATYENRMIKAELIYNVARAQQKWFEIDKDVKHLRQSREILLRYLDELDALYGDQSAMEREKVDEQIADIDVQIAKWEADQARREAELAERMRPKFDEAADKREEKRNKAMIGAGASLTVLGVGGVAMLVTGIILAKSAENQAADLLLEADIPARQNVLSRGQSGNAMMLIGTLSGAVFLAAGAPLLGVGLASEKKRKQRREAAGLEVAGIRSIAPMWTRGGVGLAIGGAF
jgi:tetratricopeptide (TPR) repeat protein